MQLLGKNGVITFIFLAAFHYANLKTDAEELFVESGTEEEVIAEDDDSATKFPTVPDSAEDIDFAFSNEDDVPEDEECSRISPKEIFHNDIHPRLLDALDEISHFVEAVLTRIESAIMVLVPQVQESPIGNLRADDLFLEVRRFLFGTMRDVYDIIRSSWRDLIRTYVTKINDAKQQINALRIVRDAQIQGEEKIKASLMELSVTLRAIILNSIYVIQESLKLPKSTELEHAASQITDKVPKLAPNFLGKLMNKMIGKVRAKETHKKILTNTLRFITGPVQKMFEPLEALVKSGRSTDDLHNYWKLMVKESHLRIIENPVEKIQYEKVFQNEEYLTELVLGLMETF